MDDSDPDGWRPDRLRVLFGGESAGGFGVMYNYHYPLDDLRWTYTTALPDSGLALDNGALGVRVLGTLISSDVPTRAAGGRGPTSRPTVSRAGLRRAVRSSRRRRPCG